MNDMYRAYNRARQCCEQKNIHSEHFNNASCSRPSSGCDTVNSNENNRKSSSCSFNYGHSPNSYHQSCDNMPIGMVYVPMQEWSEPYDACEGLYAGSAFSELNLIFCGRRSE